jgi:hypothetical protein
VHLLKYLSIKAKIKSTTLSSYFISLESTHAVCAINKHEVMKKWLQEFRACGLSAPKTFFPEPEGFGLADGWPEGEAPGCALWRS